MLNVYVTLPTGGTYYSYIKRLSDGYYYDDSDQTFKVFASLIDGQIEFAEDANVPGQFGWSRDIPDGDYVIYSLETPTDVNVAEAYLVSLRQGQEVPFVITNFGGDVLVGEIDCDAASGEGVFKFYAGEDRTAQIKIVENQADGSTSPYAISLTAVVTVKFPASGFDLSGDEVTEIIKDNDSIGGVDVVNFDRGELAVTLDEDDTNLMKSGDIIIEIQSGSTTRKARIASGVQKKTL